MGGDYSRRSFDPKNHFSGVLMQQGRVQLDADWNEMEEISDRRWRAETIDVVGRCGVPKETPSGFEIAIANGALTIGRGRIYVDGLLAENQGYQGEPPLAFDPILAETQGSTPLPYTQQPYMFNLSPTLPTGRHLVYLDVWSREVTFLEAPALIEKAVGIDTTTRRQMVWQVKLLANVGTSTTCDTPDAQIPGWLEEIRPSAGRLSTGHVEPSEDDDPCLIPPSGGYRGLENQLYRVEIHDGGVIGTATFKWSSDNGSIATAITSIPDTDKVVVAQLQWDSIRRFSTDDWIEITDDWHELAGQPGLMRKITIADDATRTITLDQALPAGEFATDADGLAARHTRIRRWDQQGIVRDVNGAQILDLDAATSTGVIPVPAATTSIILEHGIHITFDTEPTGGEFHVGDYWLFAARTADASVESLDKMPPVGIHHHYCRLALITVEEQSSQVDEDCRPLFPPLTNICAEDVCYDNTNCALNAKTVQEAIEALCQSQPGGGDGCLCTVTLGEDNVIDLRDAIERLPEEGGCICIPSGEFPQPKSVVIVGRKSITIKGCGPASIVSCELNEPLFAIFSSNDIILHSFMARCSSGGFVRMQDCSQIRAEDCTVECSQGTAYEVFGDNRNLTVEDCFILAAQAFTFEEYQLDGLFVRQNRLEIFEQAMHFGQTARLVNTQIQDNTIEGASRCLVFDFLAETADVAIVRNRITPMGEGEAAIQVRNMDKQTLLTLTENYIGTPDAFAFQGVMVELMASDARVVLEENQITSLLEAVQIFSSEGNTQVHANANIFRSAAAVTTVSIGGNVDQGTDGRLAHVLFSNNQVYSSEPHNVYTVNLNARHLIVMGNYVADQQGGIGRSIGLPREPQAATAIGNVSNNGVNYTGPVTNSVIVVNNAVF